VNGAESGYPASTPSGSILALGGLEMRHVPEVYTARELATAAGVPLERVESVMATGELPVIEGRYVSHEAAVAWGRKVRRARLAERLGSSAAVPLASEPASAGAGHNRDLFDWHASDPREPVGPAAVSAGVHLLIGTVAILLTTAGVGTSGPPADMRISDPMRLVYLVEPGPGGGGRSGGLRRPRNVKAPARSAVRCLNASRRHPSNRPGPKRRRRRRSRHLP
jgi:hypothetical protein